MEARCYRASGSTAAHRLVEPISSSNRPLPGRDSAALRAQEISRELSSVRGRLSSLEPAERDHAMAIAELQAERKGLQHRVDTLLGREEELRGRAARAIDLDNEREALEELLAEAADDIEGKDEEIQNLGKSLKRATRQSGGGSSKSKDAQALSKRFRTLYRALEMDTHAIEDLVGLRDEGMILKAEEAIKKLSEELGNGRRSPQGRWPATAPEHLRARLRGKGPHLLHAR